MGVHLSKVRCFYFPAQSGKTQRVRNDIDFYENLIPGNDGMYINIMITSNNKLLVSQTSARFSNCCNWTSDKNQSISDIILLLLSDVSTIIMCTQYIRLRHLKTLIEKLNALPIFTSKIRLWIDEADATMNQWGKYEELSSLDIIHEITLISATLCKVIKKYKRLRVVGDKNSHPECYRCSKDSIKIPIDFSGTSCEYIEHILKNHPKLIKPGMCGFIPGDSKVSSHDSITTLLVEKYNFAVLIINGDRKEIVIPGQESLDIKQYLKCTADCIPEDFNIILARLYKEYCLYDFPFAITGMMCIGRGITFQSKDFLFDYGIINTISNIDEAYQIIARLFGNVGNKAVEIYTTKTNFKKVTKLEAIAINLSPMVYEQNLQDVGIEELNEAMNLSNDLYDETWAPSFEQLKELMWQDYEKKITRRAIHTNSKGLLVSTTYNDLGPCNGNYDLLKPVMHSVFKQKAKGSYLSNTRDWVVVPVYEQEIPGTEKWYCRFKKQ